MNCKGFISKVTFHIFHVLLQLSEELSAKYSDILLETGMISMSKLCKLIRRYINLPLPTRHEHRGEEIIR